MKRLKQCHKCPHRLTALVCGECPLLTFKGKSEEVDDPDEGHISVFFATCPGMLEGQELTLTIYFDRKSS